MKKYVEPEAEIVRFQEEDIITTSGNPTEVGDGENETGDEDVDLF